MNDNVGKRVRAFRKLKNLTQQELADRIHVSVAIVGSIERGTRAPSRPVLRAIQEALGITEEELLADSLQDNTNRK